MQEQGSTSTSGSGSSSSKPTMANMAPGSVRMANPLRPPVWMQVRQSSSSGRAAKGIAAGGGERDVGPATRPRAEAPAPFPGSHEKEDREEKWFFYDPLERRA